MVPTKTTVTTYKFYEAKGISKFDYKESYAMIATDANCYIWGGLAESVGNDTTRMTQLMIPKPSYEIPYEPGDDYVAEKVVAEDNLYVLAKDGSLYERANGRNKTKKKIMRQVKDFKTNAGYTIAITKTGDVYTWKAGTTPQKTWQNVKDIAVGYDVFMAIGYDNALYMWNTEDTTPVKMMDSVQSMKIQDDTYMALTTSGDLYAWGSNNNGELGNGTREEGVIPGYIMSNVKDYEVSREGSAAALTEDGKLYLWGEVHAFYQEDTGNLYNYHLEAQVIMEDVASFSLDTDYRGRMNGDGQSLLAIGNDKVLYALGSGDSGSLGTGSADNCYEPTPIMENVIFAQDHSLGGIAINEDKELYYWGANDWDWSYYPRPQLLEENVEKAQTFGCGVTYWDKDGNLMHYGAAWWTHWMNEGAVEMSWSDTAYILTFPVDEKGDYSTEVVVTEETASANTAVAPKKKVRNTQKKIVFDELQPEQICNFYLVKDKNAENVISQENLYYISQMIASEKGTLEVTIDETKYPDGYMAFVVGASGVDISKANIKIPALTFNGQESLSVPVTVTYKGQNLQEGLDYQVSGDVVVKHAGSHKLYVSGLGEYSGTVEVSFEVNCGEHRFVLIERTMPDCVYYGYKTWQCIYCGDQKVEVLKPLGHKTIVLKRAGTILKAGYEEGICSRCKCAVLYRYIPKIDSITLSTTKYVYNGKAKKPKVTIRDEYGNVLDSKNYTITYQNNTKVGEASVVISFKNDYVGKVKKTFTIVPKATSLTSLTAGKKSITVKWNLQKTETTGYELQYSTVSSFATGKTKTITVSSNKTNSKKITGLKKGQKYYVRIRTYRTVTVNGKKKKIYSSWSASKNTKAK